VLPAGRVTRVEGARGRWVLYDDGVTGGARYVYRVALGGDGGQILFEVEVAIPRLDGAVLLPAFPNPSRGETTIAFRLPQAGPASVRIYDVRGALVADLGTEWYGEGRSEILWKGRTGENRPLPTGVYFVAVRLQGDVLRQKLMILR